MSVVRYEHDWKNPNSTTKLWEYIRSKVTKSTKVGLTFSANNRQSVELFHSYTNGKPTKSPVFGVVSGQALVIKIIADFVINTNSFDNVHILPISTISVGGKKDPEKKIIQEYALRRDLTNIYNHAVDGWHVIILTNPTEWNEPHKYQIGGLVAKYFYDDRFPVNYFKYSKSGDNPEEIETEPLSGGSFVELVLDNCVTYFSGEKLVQDGSEGDEKAKRKQLKEAIELNLLRKQPVGLSLIHYFNEYFDKKILKKKVKENNLFDESPSEIESALENTEKVKVGKDKGSHEDQVSSRFSVKITGGLTLRLEILDAELYKIFIRRTKIYLNFYWAKIHGKKIVIPTKFLFYFLRKEIGINGDVVSNMIRFCFLTREHKTKAKDFYWTKITLGEVERGCKDIYFTPTGFFFNIDYFLSLEKLFACDNLNYFDFHDKFKADSKSGFYQKFLFHYTREKNKLAPNHVEHWNDLSPFIQTIETYFKSSFMFKAADLFHLFLHVRSDIFGFNDLLLSKKDNERNIKLPNSEIFPILLNPLNFFDTAIDPSLHFFKKFKYRAPKEYKKINYSQISAISNELQQLGDFFEKNSENLPKNLNQNPLVRIFEVEEGNSKVVEDIESIEFNLKEMIQFYYSNFTFAIIHQITSAENDYKQNLIENSLTNLNSKIGGVIYDVIKTSSSNVNDFIKTVWFFNQIATISCLKGNFFLLSVIVDTFHQFGEFFNYLISEEFISSSLLPPENSWFIYDYFYFSKFLEKEKERGRIHLLTNEFQYIVIPSLKYLSPSSDPPASHLFSRLLRFLPDPHDLLLPARSFEFMENVLNFPNVRPSKTASSFLLKKMASAISISDIPTSQDNSVVTPGDNFPNTRDKNTDNLIKYLSSTNYFSNVKHLLLHSKSFENSLPSLDFIESFDPSQPLVPLDTLILQSNESFDCIFYHCIRTKDFNRINQLLSFNLYRCPSKFAEKAKSRRNSDLFSDYSSHDFSLLGNIFRFYFV